MLNMCGHIFLPWYMDQYSYRWGKMVYYIYIYIYIYKVIQGESLMNYQLASYSSYFCWVNCVCMCMRIKFCDMAYMCLKGSVLERMFVHYCYTGTPWMKEGGGGARFFYEYSIQGNDSTESLKNPADAPLHKLTVDLSRMYRMVRKIYLIMRHSQIHNRMH